MLSTQETSAAPPVSRLSYEYPRLIGLPRAEHRQRTQQDGNDHHDTCKQALAQDPKRPLRHQWDCRIQISNKGRKTIVGAASATE